MNSSNSDLEKREEALCRAVCQSFESLKAFGTSKHKTRHEHNRQHREDARAAGMSEEEIAKLRHGPSPLIHGISTFYQYVNVGKRFAKWLAVEHPEVSKLQYAHRKGYTREFIQLMIDRGLSPYTINHDTCALAKLFRCSSNDIHDNRPPRHYDEITRSRGYSEKQYAKDLKKYGDLARLLRCIGVRECELVHLSPSCFGDVNGELMLQLDGRKQHTKGGKSRTVEILPENQQIVREILAKFDVDELICPKAPSHLDIHGIRRMYANDFYDSIAPEITDEMREERVPLKHAKVDNSRPNQVRTDAPRVYRRRKLNNRELDRVAMLRVSRSLGHNRVDVMVQSYLW